MQAMKSIQWIGLALAAAVGGAVSQAQGQRPDIEQRVTALEAELGAAGGRVLELEERVQTLEAYVKEVSRSSADLSGTLAASEEAGFTAGINPRSRELLLAGWRKHLATLQQGLPKPPEEPAPPKHGR